MSGPGSTGSEHRSAPPGSSGSTAATPRRETEIATVADLGRLALSGVDANELFSRAIEDVVALMDAEHVGVFALDGGGNLRLVAGLGLTAGTMIDADAEVIEAESIRRDEPMVELAEPDAEAGVASGADLVGGHARSALTAIIRLPGRPFGLVAAYSDRGRAFSGDDVVVLRSVANILGAAIARARVEDELRERDVEGRLAFAASGMGIWHWSPASGDVRWTPELEALFGFAPGAFDGTFDGFVAVIHPDDREATHEIIERATSTESDFIMEHRIVRPDGSVRWVEGRGSPVRDATDTIIQWIGVAIDITARVEAEAHNQAAEIESRLAFAAARMGSWRWNARRQEGVWSPELEALVGVEPGSYDGTWEGFVAPILVEDHPLLIKAVLAADDGDGEFSVRYRVAHSDGSIRWVETRGRRIEAGDWIGVTLDVTELASAEAARRESEAILRATSDSAPVGLAFVDPDLAFVWVNDQQAEIDGIAVDAHAGRPVADVLPELGDTIAENLRATLTSGERILGVPLEGQTPAQPGVPRSFEHSCYPVRAESGAVIGVGMVVVETTVRRESERELEDAHARLEETVARLDTLLENGPFGFAFFDLDHAAVGLNERFAELTGRPVATSLDRTIDELVPGLVSTGSEATSDAGGVTGHSVEIGGVNSAVTGAERHWLVERYPVQSAAGRPLGSGVVAVDITEQKLRERATLLIGVANAMLAEGGPVQDWDRVAQLAVPEFADFCVLYISPRAGLPRRFAAAHVDPVKQDLLVRAEHRWPTDVERIRAAIPGSDPMLVAEVDAQRRVQFLSTDDPEERTFTEVQGARSVIVVPLQRGGRDLGVAVFACTEESGRRYHEGDIDLARQLGQRFEQLIENSYLAHDAERARARLSVLAGISDILAVDLDSQARLDAIVRGVLPSVADACAIYRPTDDGRSVRLAAFASTDAEAVDYYNLGERPTEHPLDGASPPAVVMRTGEPLLFEHMPADVLETLEEPDVGRQERAAEVQSLVVAPLPGPDGLLGVIAFGLRGPERHYEAEDLVLAGEIARRVAPAIDNALQFEQQYATASALQLALLPERLDEMTGMKIAARYLPGAVDVQVGGDWYDAVELPGGTVLVAIGDVVGHGISAATWMGNLRTLVRYCAFDGQDPATLLARLNSYCMASAAADMATVLVGLVDPVTGIVTLASAGHPPPLVQRVDGSVDVVWEGRGPPLGATTGARFESVDVVVAAGETLVLYTDGLVERRGEPFDAGLDRLAASATVGRRTPRTLEQFADWLIADALGGRAASDDVALLLLRPDSPTDELRMTLRTDATELARLRRTVGEWLRVQCASTDEIAELLVAVNELAANAIEHAYGPGDGQFLVAGTMNGSTVTLLVTDSGHWRERPRPTGRGRGLAIARQLVDDLQIDSTAAGTTVRLRRDLAGKR
ncbi:MAG: SpoIIE family protein phosphatase [Acidimicrobiia bacterium]